MALNPSIRYAASTGLLCMDSIPLLHLAQAANQDPRSLTPCYVFSVPHALRQLGEVASAFQREFSQALPTTTNTTTISNSSGSAHQNDSSSLPQFSIHFSLKSCANASVIRALTTRDESRVHPEVSVGVDCVSAGECFKGLKYGVPSDHIVFAGVGKTEEELCFALSHRVGWFNVENRLELDWIERILAEHHDKPHDGFPSNARVALRFNPDVLANTDPRIATGHHYAKFGQTEEALKEILSEARLRWPHVHIEGLHVHIGSQLGSIAESKCAVEKTVALALENNRLFVGEGPHTNRGLIQSINIGGGIPVAYVPEKEHLTVPVEIFASTLAPLVARHRLSLMMEPGRRIIGHAGVLLTKILYRKEQDGKKMLIVDASMTELIRPALYGAVHQIVPVKVEVGEVSEHGGWVASEKVSTFSIVGPVCESTDVFSDSIKLPDESAQPGGFLAILTAGAYGATMSSNYNARPLPAQIVVVSGPNNNLIKAGTPEICRSTDGKFRAMLSVRRQAYEDLISTELDL